VEGGVVRTEQSRVFGGHEAEGDALDQAARGQDAARQRVTGLARGESRWRHRGERRHRDRRDAVEALEAEDFLHEVGGRFQEIAAPRGFRGAVRREGWRLVQRAAGGDVVAPGRDVDGKGGVVAGGEREAEAFQQGHGLVGRHGEAAKFLRRVEAHRGGARPDGFGPGEDDFARFTAAKVEDHACGGLNGARHQRGVDAALETLARVRRDLVAAPGHGDMDGVEQGAFDEHLGGGLVASGGLAADHAGEGLHAGSVGDDAILGSGGVVAAVQGAEGLIGAAAESEGVASHLAHVEHVQRAA